MYFANLQGFFNTLHSDLLRYGGTLCARHSASIQDYTLSALVSKKKDLGFMWQQSRTWTSTLSYGNIHLLIPFHVLFTRTWACTLYPMMLFLMICWHFTFNINVLTCTSNTQLLNCGLERLLSDHTVFSAIRKEESTKEEEGWPIETWKSKISAKIIVHNWWSMAFDILLRFFSQDNTNTMHLLKILRGFLKSTKLCKSNKSFHV